jgi:hypothetical protein
MSGNNEVERRILCKKWLGLNQDLALKKTRNCCDLLALRNIGQYLFRNKGSGRIK